MGGLAPSTGLMKSQQFRCEREAGWQELETLLAKVETKGLRRLEASQLERLPLLYRSALSSLSVARSIALDRGLQLYLDNLGLRAFLQVYGPRSSIAAGLAFYLRYSLPQAVRSIAGPIAIATLAMLLGVFAGFWLTITDEGWFAAIVPAGLAAGRGARSSAADLAAVLATPLPATAATIHMVANALFTHNTVVGLLIFALGFLAGLPTLLLTVYQGLIFGAFLALHWDRGLTMAFMGWVSIHGVTEFLAILLCGGAGLVLGEAVVFPGRHGRIDSLSQRGQLAGQVAAGAVVLFCIAAILEGVARQAIQSTPLRFAVAALSAAAYLAYFVGAGRKGGR